MKVVTLEVRPDQVYTNRLTGATWTYTAYVAKIGGAEIRFYPRKEDQKLLDFVLDSVEDE